MHWLTSVQITTLLTDALCQGHSLYVAVLSVLQGGGFLLSVVYVREAVTITPYYQQEVQSQPGDKRKPQE